MPVLRYHENVIDIVLPSTKDKPAEEQYIVKLDVAPLIAEDVIRIETTQNVNVIKRDMVKNRIRGWNLTDAELKPLDINSYNVGLLPPDDLFFLYDTLDNTIKQAEGLSPAEKKS